MRPGADTEKDVSLRVVADHARAVSFLIGDGVLPSNEGRGYVLRRILRRAARHGVLLGVERPFLYLVADAVIDEMGEAYPDLVERRAYIMERVRREEERFLETLARGLTLLEGEIGELKARGGNVLPGEVVFRLYDTFGFPLDLTADILVGHHMTIDQPGFDFDGRATRRARAAWKGSGQVAVAGPTYLANQGACASSILTRCVWSTITALLRGHPVAPTRATRSRSARRRLLRRKWRDVRSRRDDEGRQSDSGRGTAEAGRWCERSSWPCRDG